MGFNLFILRRSAHTISPTKKEKAKTKLAYVVTQDDQFNFKPTTNVIGRVTLVI